MPVLADHASVRVKDASASRVMQVLESRMPVLADHASVRVKDASASRSCKC